MSIISLIVFIVVLLFTYLATISVDRFFNGEWNFKLKLSSLFMPLITAAVYVFCSDFFVDNYVNKNVPHEWREETVFVQNVEDVSRRFEKEGNFLNIHERETFRYTVVREDGLRVREKLYTSDCFIMKADKKQQIVLVRNVRIYKNPADKKFFSNTYDKRNGFYKVFLL